VYQAESLIFHKPNKGSALKYKLCEAAPVKGINSSIMLVSWFHLWWRYLYKPRHIILFWSPSLHWGSCHGIMNFYRQAVWQVPTKGNTDLIWQILSSSKLTFYNNDLFCFQWIRRVETLFLNCKTKSGTDAGWIWGPGTAPLCGKTCTPGCPHRWQSPKQRNNWKIRTVPQKQSSILRRLLYLLML